MESGLVRIAFIIMIAFAAASAVYCAGEGPVRGNGLNEHVPVVESMDPRQRKPLPEGTWGGRGIQMSVNADSAAIQFDCADGEIQGKIYVRADGTFSADGTFTQRRPGPVRPNEPPPVAARYTGKLSGSKMTLKITLAADGSGAGEYTLEQGRSGRIVRCL